MTKRPDASAIDRLHQALVVAATRGDRPRCSEPGAHEMWLSEDRDDRATAARWCKGCPVLAVCGQAADAVDERFGVWGGRDRTPSPRTKP